MCELFPAVPAEAARAVFESVDSKRARRGGIGRSGAEWHGRALIAPLRLSGAARTEKSTSLGALRRTSLGR